MGCCPIRAGSLRHVIDIHAQSSTRDSYGDDIISWTTRSSNVRCNVTPIGMDEKFDTEQWESQFSKKFLLRFSSAIVPTDSIIYKSERYNIKSLININEADRMLEIIGNRIST